MVRAARSGGNTTEETATHSGNEYITKKEKIGNKHGDKIINDGFFSKKP